MIILISRWSSVRASTTSWQASWRAFETMTFASSWETSMRVGRGRYYKERSPPMIQWFRTVFCDAWHKSLYGEKIQWLIVGMYEVGVWDFLIFLMIGKNRRCLVLLGKIPKKNLFTKTWGCDSPAGPVVGSASRRTQLHKRAGSLLHIYQSAMEIMIVYVADLDGAAGDDGDGDPADLLVQRRSSQWGTLSKDNLQQGHHHHKAKPACGQQGLGWDRGARIHFGVFSTSCLVPLALISDWIFLLKYNFAVFWISPQLVTSMLKPFFIVFFFSFYQHFKWPDHYSAKFWRKYVIMDQ